MSNRQRLEPWRNAERHCCEICNAWMGSDRQSIMLHENGKKHLENVEKALQKKRSAKADEEKDHQFLQASLQKMEQAAMQSHLQQDSLVSSMILRPAAVSTSSMVPPRVGSLAPVRSMQAAPPPPSTSSKKEKEGWLSRKKKRQGGDAENQLEDSVDTNKRRKIEPGEGHYDRNGKTYLEGSTFFEILEEDMPVQLWVGPMLANLQEKRLIDRDVYWKDALIAAVRKKLEQCTVHVAYLASPDDTQETLAKNVPVDKIRIVLGADESIPTSVEEARLLAMGGEEIQVDQPQSAEVDEATGLSGWSTVTIKRTTARQEVKVERSRLRDKRNQDIAEKESLHKEAEARRMEEAKVANADDSALGAYDVWGKGGYKGVDISATENPTTVADTAKSLSSGKGSVAFKKKKRKPRSTRRTTSADDED